MKCIFIYNPVGGKGKIVKKLDYIVRELQKKYDIVDVYPTKCAGDMITAVRDAASKYDAIIFSGGDGSFNEVVRGVVELENIPALGYIPSGTVNDVAHTLKIPTNIKKALKVILSGRVEKLDCMKVNDTYVMYVVAAGAFTSTTYATPQDQKNYMGRLAYGLHGIKNNLIFRVFNVFCRGKREIEHADCVLISVMNSRYVAGFKMNKDASLIDGQLEVAIVRQKKKANIFEKIIGYFSVAKLFLFGYGSIKERKHITKMSGASFDIKVDDDVVWTFDGEKGATGSVHVEVVSRKIPVIIPKNYKF